MKKLFIYILLVLFIGCNKKDDFHIDLYYYTYEGSTEKKESISVNGLQLHVCSIIDIYSDSSLKDFTIYCTDKNAVEVSRHQTDASINPRTYFRCFAKELTRTELTVQDNHSGNILTIPLEISPYTIDYEIENVSSLFLGINDKSLEDEIRREVEENFTPQDQGKLVFLSTNRGIAQIRMKYHTEPFDGEIRIEKSGILLYFNELECPFYLYGVGNNSIYISPELTAYFNKRYLDQSFLISLTAQAKINKPLPSVYRPE